MIRLGIVGYGYWGPKLARNFAEASGAQLVAVCDSREKRLASVRSRYPGVATGTSFRDLIANSQIDAVVIATPVSTHFDLAYEALKSGKHVLVEKPLAASSEQALRLIEEAERRRLVLMVDHTFVYTGAVRKMKELVKNSDLGEIYYYDSVRINLGLFQHDVNVIWDLAVHDLSIMDHVLPSRPRAVAAVGTSHVAGEPENMAYLTLFFDGSLIAHLHVNWLAPVKVRRTLLSGSRRMVVYDDLEPSEKIKVYDRGVTFSQDPASVYEMLAGYRMGDMWAPQLDMTEALRTEAIHFIRCIEERERPVTDGASGLRVVRILEATTQSMSNRGEPVDLQSAGGAA